MIDTGSEAKRDAGRPETLKGLDLMAESRADASGYESELLGSGISQRELSTISACGSANTSHAFTRTIADK